MALLLLPYEILLGVAMLSDKPTIFAIIQTCHLLHSLFGRLLYRHLTFGRENGGLNIDDMAKFLERPVPELAYTQILTVCDPFTLNDDNVRLMLSLMVRLKQLKLQILSGKIHCDNLAEVLPVLQNIDIQIEFDGEQLLVLQLGQYPLTSHRIDIGE